MNKSSAIINGCWQLAKGHTFSPTNTHVTDLFFNYIEAGLTTFDCADIYCGVEEHLGQLRREASRQGIDITVHTKYVPNKDALADLTFQCVEKAIVSSCEKLATETLDLVQFHWWDYARGDYLQVLEWLTVLKDKGLIKEIGLTNFNGTHLRRILQHGISIYSIQTQYSFLDKRLEKEVFQLAQTNAIKIFCYGVLAGGFFSINWLNQPEPTFQTLKNRSLIKYLLIIQEYGGWNKFQALLRTLHKISEQVQCSISEVVVLYFIKYTKIDAVILGIRLTFERNPLNQLKLFSLTTEEKNDIQNYFDFVLAGDIYDLERNSEKHASIMKYNLNKE